MNRLAATFLFLWLAACSPATEAPVTETQASNTAEVADYPAWGHGGMVSAAEPYAVEAAIEMLNQGGHAVDAAIAAHAVLSLVEPQSSGIGGSAFMMVFEAEDKDLSYYEGRETAPAAATVDMFMRDGEPMGGIEAWAAGISVGVPGTVSLYETAHENHGRLPWSVLFQPAIKLAREGFAVPERYANYMPMMAERTPLDENPVTGPYFYPGGEGVSQGDIVTNPEYADLLAMIASEGASAFYTGEFAAEMAAAANAEPVPGAMTVEDIAAYRAMEREPVCGAFRTYEICSASPPSSGAMMIMVARLYDHLAGSDDEQADKVAAFVDAQRLAYADRDQYFGDPDVVGVPLEDLINPEYLKHRATERFAPGAVPTPGNPADVLHRDEAAAEFGIDRTAESVGTTHFSIIDDDGNAVSMTASVGYPFGSTRMVGGFLLNNQMTDFSREYRSDAPPQANAIAPGKRPRSSMSPTIVFDEDRNVVMITGSPGGNSIPAYVIKTIVGVLDWDMSAQEAVDFPNIIARGPQVRVEINVEHGQAVADDLSSRGYDVQERDGENSGLHVIVVRPDGLEGAADKRRRGIVRTTAPN